jgi:hypothetical protein
VILRALRWLWLTDVSSWPTRAFNFLWFQTFGFEEHLRAKFELETKQAHRGNVRLYADIQESLKEA